MGLKFPLRTLVLALLIALSSTCVLEPVLAQSGQNSFQRGKLINQNRKPVRQQQRRVIPIRRDLAPLPAHRNTGLDKIQEFASMIANGILVIGCVVGGPLMLWGFFQLAIGAADGVVSLLLGLGGVVGGLITPHAINWLFDYARNANMF